MTLELKRIYEPYEKSDGFRILVDRLWPRGIKKENAHVDLWLKDVAPSNELRKWFNHDPKKWITFLTRYQSELKTSAALNELLILCKKHEKITLLYAAKDEEHNQAVALRNMLK